MTCTTVTSSVRLAVADICCTRVAGFVLTVALSSAVYNEALDNWHRITFKQCVENAVNVFDIEDTFPVVDFPQRARDVGERRHRQQLGVRAVQDVIGPRAAQITAAATRQRLSDEGPDAVNVRNAMVAIARGYAGGVPGARDPAVRPPISRLPALQGLASTAGIEGGGVGVAFQRVLRPQHELIGAELTATEAVAHVAALDADAHLALPLQDFMAPTAAESDHPQHVRGVLDAQAAHLGHIKRTGAPCPERASAVHDALDTLAVALFPGDDEATAEARSGYTEQRKTAFGELNRCTLDVLNDKHSMESVADRYTYVDIGTDTRTRCLGAWFGDQKAFADATRTMPSNILPSFMREHLKPTIAAPTHRKVELEPAASRSDGFCVAPDGHVCVYTSAINADGKIGRATRGSTTALRIEGKTQKADWNGVNAHEAALCADRQFKQPRMAAVSENPLDICHRVVHAAEAGARGGRAGTAARNVGAEGARGTEWRHIGAPRLHSGRGAGDDVDNLLYAGYDPVVAQPTSAELRYARHVIEHADRMQIGLRATDGVGEADPLNRFTRAQTIARPAAFHLGAGGVHPAASAATRRTLLSGAGGYPPVEIAAPTDEADPTVYRDLMRFAIPVTHRFIKYLIDRNLRVPFDVLLLRPFSPSTLVRCACSTLHVCVLIVAFFSLRQWSTTWRPRSS